MWYIWSCTICANDCFLPNYYFVKDDHFHVSLLSRKDNWWGRLLMVSLFSWWVLRRFNLFCHIYIGSTNISFCERLSCILFNCTCVILTIVFLTRCDFTSYSIVLPISISSLVLRLWSICYRSIIYVTFTLALPKFLFVSV